MHDFRMKYLEIKEDQAEDHDISMPPQGKRRALAGKIDFRDRTTVPPL
jgi:hypothetical protein